MYVLQKYKDVEGVVKIEEVDGEELVKKFAEEMEEMLGRKMKSVKVRVCSVKANTHTHFMITSFADMTLFQSCVTMDFITLSTWGDCIPNQLCFIAEVSRSSGGC